MNLTKNKTTFLTVEAVEDTKAAAYCTYTTREKEDAKCTFTYGEKITIAA